MKKSLRPATRNMYRPLWMPMLVVSFFLQTPAHAQKDRITLKVKNVSLFAVMDSIQQQTVYRFSYNLVLVPALKQTFVSVNSSSGPIEKLLPILFDRKKFNFRVMDNLILLSKADTEPLPKQASEFLQVLKGKVTDRESSAPLSHVSIFVINDSSGQGTITDSNGLFSLRVPIGKLSLRCSYIGYQDQIVSGIAVISGKETSISVEMQEAAKTMQTVTVNAKDRRDRSLNSMATVSSRMLKPEDASRFAGGYNDPARMVSALPGVISGGEGRNNLIIRGNAPKGVLWRLEGIEIPNPSHFPRGQGDGGGVFSIITANLLSDFDFFTGAFPAEYGNALSGVMDLNLRKGNPDKTEYGIEVGMIGTQVSVEGPLSKKNKSSFLVNYRYGNLQFLDKIGILGLDDNQKPPVFQDFSMHFNFPTKKAGTFSLFGIGGFSKTGTKRSTDTMSWSRSPDLRDEEDEKHQFGVLGLKHNLQLPNLKTNLRTILSLSWQSDRFERERLDDDLKPELNEKYRYNFPSLRFSTSINHKFNSNNVIKAGLNYSQFFFDVYGTKLNTEQVQTPYVDQRGSTGLAEAYFQWKHQLLERLELNTGLHATAFLLNDNYIIEPRLGAKWYTGSRSSLSYGFGLHSRIEPIFLYYLKKTGPSGTITQPNLNLKPTKAMHHVLGYDWALSKNLRLKVEAYYQYLYDVPVANDSSSTFSILNSVDRIADSAYVNKGKGYNKGVEVTFEKFFSDNYYFLLSGSVFDSKYKPLNGKKYNTYFNTNYQANALIGKDFKAGTKGQNIFSLNFRAIVHGGFRYTIARVLMENGMPRIYYPSSETYTSQVPRFLRFDMGIKYRKNNPGYSWILSLDVQNLSNRQNVLTYGFGSSPDGRISKHPEEDLGIIPILNLKVEF